MAMAVPQALLVANSLTLRYSPWVKLQDNGHGCIRGSVGRELSHLMLLAVG